MHFLQLTLNCNWRGRLRGALPGLLLAGLGLVALSIATTLPFRLPSGRPGPGFVPMLIAAALSVLAMLLAATGAARGAPSGRLPARPGLMLCAAIPAFGLLLPTAGFLPAAWAAASLALLATPGLGALRVVFGGLALAGGAALLFLGLLGIPAPLLGPR
jgi:hypothetical protein